MIREVDLDEKPSVIKVDVLTNRREKIWIKVKDKNRPNTYYTKRYGYVNGKKSFFVNMPQAPDEALVIVYNARSGLVKGDGSFRVRIGVKPLKATEPKMSKKTKSFVKFAQEFAEECGYLTYSEEGVTYRSNNGKFRIDYFDTIRNSKGKKINTPARISQVNGKIEISASRFLKYSIPMRMAILLHEYAHFYLNKSPHSEEEADEHSLRLYLGLEYPKIDILNVFLNVFKKSPSESNKRRFELLEEYIRTQQE
jgi:hypothetical protein